MTDRKEDELPRRPTVSIETYVVALVLAIVVPVVWGTALLFQRQVSDVAAIERKQVGLATTVRIDFVLERLRVLRRVTLRDGTPDLQRRLAVEAEMTRLRDYASGPGRSLGVEDPLGRLLGVWHSVPEHGLALHQIDRTIAAALNFSRVVEVRSSLRSDIADRTAALVDAFTMQLPTIDDRADQEQNVILSAYHSGRGLGAASFAVGIFTSEIGRAYRNAAFDVNVVSASDGGDVRTKATIAELGRRLDELRTRARSASSGSLAVRRDLRPLIIAGRGFDRSIDASMASLLAAIDTEFSRSLAIQLDYGRRLRLGSAAASLISAILGFFLFRAIRAKARREEEAARSDRARRAAEADRARAERLLALTEARFEAVFDRTSLGIAIVDEAGALVRSNEAVRAMFGASIPNFHGAGSDDFRRLLAGELTSYTVESPFVSDDRERWCEADVSMVREAGSGVSFAVAIVKDVTDRRETAERLRRAARYDSLVDLPNRTHLVERLTALVDERPHASATAGFAVLTLDEFVAVVDSLGPTVGDRLLVDASARLRNAIDRSDFAARLDFNTFAVVFAARADRRDVVEGLERVLRTLERPYAIDDREVVVRPRAGLVEIDRAYASVDDLFADADCAAMAAKSPGNVHYAIFDPSMRDRAARRVDVLGHLRRALDRDQLYLMFQPVVALDTASLVAFETLVRWNHPELGSVAPSEFVPIAEETGLIVSIGRWVFERTCAQLRIWRRSAPRTRPTYVCINVSVGELMRDDYGDFVESTLARHALRGSDIVLEVTEGVMLLDGSPAQRNLDRLRTIGVRFSIDDFGTGFSSLQYLHAFRFDYLKIDQAFVRSATGAIANPEIVAMVSALGRSVNVKVVAEGVETLAQAAHLRALGVDFAQGFHFGKAVVASAAGGLLERDHAVAKARRSSVIGS